MGRPGSTLKRRVGTIDLSRTAHAASRETGRKLQSSRERILERDGYTCRKCGRVTMRLEVDHIVPLHLGGADSDHNKQALCKACHRIKSRDEERERLKQ